MVYESTASETIKNGVTNTWQFMKWTILYRIHQLVVHITNNHILIESGRNIHNICAFFSNFAFTELYN